MVVSIVAWHRGAFVMIHAAIMQSIAENSSVKSATIGESRIGSAYLTYRTPCSHPLEFVMGFIQHAGMIPMKYSAAKRSKRLAELTVNVGRIRVLA